VDGTLNAIQTVPDGFEDDFTDHGFQETWLADYSRE
jgi:hypothetical protein